MMLDDMQEKITKLLVADSKEYFVANDSRFECYFRNSSNPRDMPFSKWKKDENSPSSFREAKVHVYDRVDGGGQLEGLVLVQKDDSAVDPLCAVLYVKTPGADKWQSMHPITSLIV